MKYRKANKEDIPNIKEFCQANKVGEPYDMSFTLLAYDDRTGAIVGLVSVKNLAFIEPLISSNPLVINKLTSMVHGILMAQNVDNVYLYCDEDKEEFFNKLEFTVKESNKLIMERRL